MEKLLEDIWSEVCVTREAANIGLSSPEPAERHAGCPCVTASMDDIYFDHTIR
jgi:hypothetical protein